MSILDKARIYESVITAGCQEAGFCMSTDVKFGTDTTTKPAKACVDDFTRIN